VELKLAVWTTKEALGLGLAWYAPPKGQHRSMRPYYSGMDPDANSDRESLEFLLEVGIV